MKCKLATSEHWFSASTGVLIASPSYRDIVLNETESRCMGFAGVRAPFPRPQWISLSHNDLLWEILQNVFKPGRFRNQISINTILSSSLDLSHLRPLATGKEGWEWKTLIRSRLSLPANILNIWFSFPSKKRIYIFLCQIALALHVVSLPVHEVLSRQPILCVLIAMGTRLVSTRHQATNRTDAFRLLRNLQVLHGPWSSENVFVCKDAVDQTGQGKMLLLLPWHLINGNSGFILALSCLHFPAVSDVLHPRLDFFGQSWRRVILCMCHAMFPNLNAAPSVYLPSGVCPRVSSLAIPSSYNFKVWSLLTTLHWFLTGLS